MLWYDELEGTNSVFKPFWGSVILQLYATTHILIALINNPPIQAISVTHIMLINMNVKHVSIQPGHLHLILIFFPMALPQDLGCHGGIIHELLAEQEGLMGMWRLVTVRVCVGYTTTFDFYILVLVLIMMHWGMRV